MKPWITDAIGTQKVAEASSVCQADFATGDAALRIFLFQLLAVQGQWERSLNQLNVAAELDAVVAHIGGDAGADGVSAFGSRATAGNR